MENLLRHTLATCLSWGSTSATSDPFTNKVDMVGWNGVKLTGFDTSTGNTTAGNKLTAYGATSSTATSTSDGFRIIGAALSSTKGTGKKLFEIDVIYPRQRYVAARITRSTAVIFGPVLAERYAAPRLISSTKTSTDTVGTPKLIQPQTTGSTST